jgi:hypothetical protein
LNEFLAECERLMEAGQRVAAKRCLEAAEEELLVVPAELSSDQSRGWGEA